MNIYDIALGVLYTSEEMPSSEKTLSACLRYSSKCKSIIVMQFNYHHKFDIVLKMDIDISKNATYLE